jgi:hypothetical protein
MLYLWELLQRAFPGQGTLARQGRGRHQQHDDRLVIVKGRADFPADPVVLVVDPPSAVLVLDRQPVLAHDSQEHLALQHLLLQPFRPAIAAAEVLIVLENLHFAEAVFQFLGEVIHNGLRVGLAVADENHGAT